MWRNLKFDADDVDRGGFDQDPAHRPAARRGWPRSRSRIGAGLVRLLLDRVGQRAELAAQRVDLVEQREHERHGLLLDREVVAQVADQAEPRDVELGEQRLAAAPARRPHPAALDPGVDLDPVDPADQRA